MPQNKRNPIAYFFGIPFKNYGDNDNSLILVSDLSNELCASLYPELLEYVSEENKNLFQDNGYDEYAVNHNGAIELLVACDCECCRFHLRKTYR